MTAAGPHAVTEALEAELRVLRVFVEPQVERRARELLQAASQAGVPVSRVGRGECDRLAGVRSQGLAAEILFRYADFDAVLEAASTGAPEPPSSAVGGGGQVAGGGRLLVFLDGIQDPHNLGAIARTAEAAGASALVLPGRHAAAVSPAVMRVSAGAAAHLPICRVTNLARALRAACERGFWAVGLDARAPALLAAPEPGAHIALVVGGEAEGLRRLVREACDELARLPMAGRVASLNASAAAAVAIYRVSPAGLWPRR